MCDGEGLRWDSHGFESRCGVLLIVDMHIELSDSLHLARPDLDLSLHGAPLRVYVPINSESAVPSLESWEQKDFDQPSKARTCLLYNINHESVERLRDTLFFCDHLLTFVVSRSETSKD